MPQGKVFDLGRDKIESLLPASDFGPNSGNLDSAIFALSNLLGHEDAKLSLEKLFSRMEDLTSNPLVILSNIRRWALQGLQDEDLLAKLEGRGLVAPDPLSASTNRTKASRSITARQARCVLANAFIGNCIDAMASHKDPGNVGGLDFSKMLRRHRYKSIEVGLSKMECLVTYFDICGSLEGTDDDERVITFNLVQFVPLSAGSLAGFIGNVKVVGEGLTLHAGTMESPPRKTSAFVNFANRNYGYGKFCSGCTQEEILLMCCPELIVGMCFIGKMKDCEVVNIQGVRRYCQYSGYLYSFQCEGPVSSTEEPSIMTVLTLDACYERHFAEDMLWRDMSKAYYSFLEFAAASDQHKGDDRPIVSTGKWGCGAFRGVPAHKMLQQAVAAAAAGVDLDFSCFGSYEGCDDVIRVLREMRPTVAEVIDLLQNCKDQNSFLGDALQFLQRGKSMKVPASLVADVSGLV